MQWLIALGLIVAFLAAMPRMLRWVKGAGAKGRLGGVALALGVAFSFLFDPAKAEAMEHIADRKAQGGESAGQGDLLD